MSCCPSCSDESCPGPLEAFHHGTFDVVIITGEEVNGPGPEQSLEQLTLHLVQIDLHGTCQLGAALAGDELRHTLRTLLCNRKIPGPVIGLSVLATVDQVPLQLFPRTRRDGLSLGEGVVHRPVQHVTSVTSALTSSCLVLLTCLSMVAKLPKPGGRPSDSCCSSSA